MGPRNLQISARPCLALICIASENRSFIDSKAYFVAVKTLMSIIFQTDSKDSSFSVVQPTPKVHTVKYWPVRVQHLAVTRT